VPLTCVFAFLFTVPPPLSSTLFPYTTLFRSLGHGEVGARALREPPPSPGPAAEGEQEERAQEHGGAPTAARTALPGSVRLGVARSEEHTSELQSRENLVCRLLLEKKNKNTIT